MSTVRATRVFHMSLDKAYKFCLFFFTMSNPNPASCGTGRLSEREIQARFARPPGFALVEWSYPERFVVDKPIPGGIGRTEMMFRPSIAGVEVTWNYSVRPAGFAGWLLTFVVRRQMARTKGEADYVAQNLMRLKADAEHTDPGLEQAFVHFQSQLEPASEGPNGPGGPAVNPLVENGRALVECAALCNVLALSQPDQSAVDMKGIAVRDLFARLAHWHLIAIQDGRAGDEFAEVMNDALEDLERKHRTGKLSAEAAVARCHAWQAQLALFVSSKGSEGMEQADPGRLRNFLKGMPLPDEASIARIEGQFSHDEREGILRSLRLWGERGYMNPRKAKRAMGMG